MQDYNTQKKNFERYLGTRKYKMSFWGLNPHVDWFILIFYIAIGFILISVNGYFEYKKINAEISEEVFIPRENKKFDVNKIDELLYEYSVQKGEQVKDFESIDQNQ